MTVSATGGHQREHGSLLARVEKRALIWIAERLPAGVGSDALSALGLGAMMAAGAALWAAQVHTGWLFVVVAALAINWFGDSLDGTVARVRDQQRPNYGFYIDHVIDVVGAFFLFGGLALSPIMSPTIALVLLVAYLMVSAEVYLATHALGVFRISMFRIGPTELRILLSVGLVYAFFKPIATIAGGQFLLFDVGGLVAIVGMFVALASSTIRNTVALYKAEPLPERPAETRRALRVSRQAV